MKRNIYKLTSSAKQGLFALALLVSGAAHSQVTYSFAYTGAIQTQTLAPGNWGIQCWGANGGDATAGPGGGGIGGYSYGAFNVVTNGTLLSILVGGKGANCSGTSGPGGAGGWNGGGGGGTCGKSGGGGGGASDVRSGGIAATNRIIVAGGGGGASYYTLLAAGGNGGATTAGFGNFITSGNVLTVGGGGAGAVGGAPGLSSPFFASTDGTATGGGGGGNSPTGFGQQGIGGGAGGAGGTIAGGATGGSGGGGGGYAGGAGGSQTTNAGVGGGGGSGYTGGLTNAITTSTGQLGYVPNPTLTTGNGYVIITALCTISVSNTGVNPICSGNSATLTTNAISNYVWSNGGTTSSVVVTPSVTTFYVLTATSPSNCTASAVITVSVDNTPSVSAVVSPSIVCANKPVFMTASGASSYAWTGGITNGVAYTPTLAGSYTYTATGTNACGNSTAAVALTVNPAPTITGSANNPTVCSGNPIILNGFGSAAGYTWSAGAPNNSPFVPPASNNYVVTGVGSNGCTSTAIVGVTVLITPTVTPVVTPTAICLGATATLSAVGATGYTWSPGSNPFTSTVAVSPQIPTTYTVTRTNGVCISNSTVNLIVYPLPLVNATGTPSQICAGTGVNLTVVGPITNTWIPGGFNAANFTLYPNFSTCYTVTGSNGNCTLSSVVCVIVNPTPTISISSSTTTICEGQNVTLTGSGGNSYTWEPSFNNNPVEVVSPLVTSLYTLTADNSFSCTTSITKVIVVNPLPDMTLSTSLPFICVGQTAILNVTNPSNNVVYNWSNGPTGPSISVNPSITTVYIATGTNANTGCTNSNSITLSVYIATFSVISPTAICKGETATLTAVGPAGSYFWNANGGVTAPSVTVSPVITTTYNVTGTTGSCNSSTTVPLIVHPIPNVSGQTAKSQICRFEVSTITGNGATSYSWNTGASTQTISFTLSLTTTYTLTGTDVNGCSKTTTVTQYVATCIGIDEQNASDNSINIYPNPNNGEFTIQSQTAVHINILNELGQVVRTAYLSETETQLNVANLAKGIYMITAEKKGFVTSKKLIIQ